MDKPKQLTTERTNDLILEVSAALPLDQYVAEVKPGVPAKPGMATNYVEAAKSLVAAAKHRKTKR